MTKNDYIRQFARASGLDVYGLGKDRFQWEAALERFCQMLINDADTVVIDRACFERGCACHSALTADQDWVLVSAVGIPRSVTSRSDQSVQFPGNAKGYS
jgi:hypothetical protein